MAQSIALLTMDKVAQHWQPSACMVVQQHVDCAQTLRILTRSPMKAFLTFLLSAFSEIRSRIFLQYEIVCASRFSFSALFKDPELITQFILVCSTNMNLPNRISEYMEICSRIFSLSRDLCFGIMNRRLEFLKIAKLRQSCDSFCVHNLQETTFVCTIETYNFWLHYCIWKHFKHYSNG